MSTERMNYQEAYEALMAIANNIESGNVTIDQIENELKKAQTYVNICKDKLRSTEENIDLLIQSFTEEDEN